MLQRWGHGHNVWWGVVCRSAGTRGRRRSQRQGGSARSSRCSWSCGEARLAGAAGCDGGHRQDGIDRQAGPQGAAWPTGRERISRQCGPCRSTGSSRAERRTGEPWQPGPPGAGRGKHVRAASQPSSQSSVILRSDVTLCEMLSTRARVGLSAAGARCWDRSRTSCHCSISQYFQWSSFSLSHPSTCS